MKLILTVRTIIVKTLRSISHLNFSHNTIRRILRIQKNSVLYLNLNFL